MWFSVEERIVSALIAGFLITLFFSLFIYYKRGDIFSNLTSMLQLLVLGVVGGGVVQALQTSSEYKVKVDELRAEDSEENKEVV